VTVRVAFPVLFGTLRLHLDKGRQWSVVEHLLLHALCEKPRTAAELAVEGNLPHRLVIEVVVRLMHSTWVELVVTREQIGFRATAFGRNVVKQDSLPAVSHRVSRKASFAIDKVSGTIFRSRDLTLYNPKRLQELKTKDDVIILPAASEMPVRSPDEVIALLLDDDEQYRGIDPDGARLLEWYAVVTVHGDSIEGLPSGAPKSLRDLIQGAAQGQPLAPLSAFPASAVDRATGRFGKALEIAFDRRGLIIGGDAHRRTLENTLRRARSWIVLHSTFVRADAFRTVLPLLGDAALRGARIDILWGKSSDPDGSNSTAAEVERCRGMLADGGIRERIRLHPFTTGSHAKLLLADDGRGQFTGIIGSCNWLYSGFESYDVSAQFSDPLMVAEIAGQLSVMADGGKGYWSELTRDLAGHAANLRRAPRPIGRRMQAALVLGADHNAYMQLARDNAGRRIVVASHRLGGSADTSILSPARAAVNAHHVEVTLYYGAASGPVDGFVAAGLVRAAGADGIQLRRIFEPRLHAKFLVWDDNHAVVTSQNWLSADPPDGSPHSEIGVFLSGAGIGRDIVERTRSALSGS
jgi:cardiolipin synthase